MSRLTVELETGGTPFELQTRNGTTTDRWFDVVAGGLHDLPDSKGENAEIAQKAGADPLPFLDRQMLITVPGYVAGVGLTPGARRTSFRAQMDALRVQLPSAGTMVILKAYPPNFGLSGTEVASITAQLQRFKMLPPLGWEHQDLTFELLCISDPVAWTVTGAP